MIKSKPIEDSEEYCYYTEDDETDSAELDEIIRQAQAEGIDLNALLIDPS